MKPRIVVAIFSILFFSHGQAEPDSGAPWPTVTVAINTFKSSFAKGEAVPCAFAIMNCGTSTVYVATMVRPMIRLVDGNGRAVPTGPLPEPPPPPPSHYMERNGKRVLMQPVWELPPGGGKTLVVPDALRHHRDNVSSGEYTFHCPIDWLSSYSEEQIVIRPNLKERLWVEAGAVVERVQGFPSNRVTIRIKGVPNDQSETQVGTMDKGQVHNFASRAAEAEGYDLKEFTAPKITFDSKTKQWSLFLEGTIVPAPRNHFWVLVDDKTGKARVRHGE